MFILKKDNVERIVSTEKDKNKLISLGFKDISPEELKKSKKKKVEDAD